MSCRTIRYTLFGDGGKIIYVCEQDVGEDDTVALALRRFGKRADRDLACLAWARTFKIEMVPP